jgi:hypothetical protein
MSKGDAYDHGDGDAPPQFDEPKCPFLQFTQNNLFPSIEFIRQIEQACALCRMSHAFPPIPGVRSASGKDTFDLGNELLRVYWLFEHPLGGPLFSHDVLEFVRSLCSDLHEKAG